MLFTKLPIYLLAVILFGLFSSASGCVQVFGTFTGKTLTMLIYDNGRYVCSYNGTPSQMQHISYFVQILGPRHPPLYRWRMYFDRYRIMKAYVDLQVLDRGSNNLKLTTAVWDCSPGLIRQVEAFAAV